MIQMAIASCRMNNAGILIPNAPTSMPVSFPHHTRKNPRTIGISSQSGDTDAASSALLADAAHLGALVAAAASASVPAMSNTPPVFVERNSKSPLIVEVHDASHDSATP